MTDASHLDTISTLVPFVVWLMAVAVIGTWMHLTGRLD